MPRLFACFFSLLLIFAFAGPIIRATDSEYASAGGNSASLVPRLVKFSVHSSTIRASRLKGLSA